MSPHLRLKKFSLHIAVLLNEPASFLSFVCAVMSRPLAIVRHRD